MGPILIFDKSFLQSLTLDESVWLDKFFNNVICPIFFSETLADLHKSVRDGRKPEGEVRIIASKTPQMSITVNAYHQDICMGNMMGYPVGMDRRPLLPEGRLVEVEGKKGVVFEPAPEVKAFKRWQEERFEDLERDYARQWRETTKKADFDSVADRLNQLGVTIKKNKSLEEAKAQAEMILDTPRSPIITMKLVFSLLVAPAQSFMPCLYFWGNSGCPPLKYFAPYVYHVLTVELFFYIAIFSDLISRERKSNKIDVAYLFYAPFCNIFVSTDKLHRRCAPVFMNSMQEFVWGPDLKADLNKIDSHFDALPDSVKDLGLYSFASYPPVKNESLVCKLWDTYCPIWRKHAAERGDRPFLPKNIRDSGLPAYVNQFANAKKVAPGDVDFDGDQADAMVLKRMVTRKRGKWFQIGKYIEIDDADKC